MTTTAITKQYKINSTIINVPISDVILTPATCASLVNEVMKNLLYQRSQIPYPYAWLKNIVKKKRRSLEESEENSVKNFTLSRHYQVVSAAYDCVENITESLVKAFTYYGNQLKEVLFVIGVTPLSPKEVFTIKMSTLSSGHVESNHVAENSKKQPKILRGIFLENAWMSLTETSMSCSNTYVFLKLSGSVHPNLDSESVFSLSKPLSFNPSVKHTVICLNYDVTEKFVCCDKLEVFKDDITTPNKIHSSIVQSPHLVGEEENEDIWLQARTLIKGFKDCFINKVSASELW